MQVHRSTHQQASMPQVQTIYFDSVHTAEQPYCSDLSCECHFDVLYHDQVTTQTPGLDDAALETALASFLISNQFGSTSSQ